jgi:hypothetical protein
MRRCSPHGAKCNAGTRDPGFPPGFAGVHPGYGHVEVLV